MSALPEGTFIQEERVSEVTPALSFEKAAMQEGGALGSSWEKRESVRKELAAS